jgi:hypothetical protein
MATGGRCRDFDLADRSVLPDGRPVPIDHSARLSLPDWGWHALDGLITLVVGILILAQWPVSGLWVIGLFLGIKLLIYGGAWIAIALSLRSAGRITVVSASLLVDRRPAPA